MNLIKDSWTNKDGELFMQYLQSFARPEKEVWTRKIINTKLPLLAIPMPTLKAMAKEILKGDFISFLNLNLNYYYENLVINGLLICKIKNFYTFKEYLLNYLEYVDNWANCDLLPIKLTKDNEKELFNLSLQFIKSKKIFARRIAVIIWFSYINTTRLDEIFKIINNLKENEYYVNMCVAWFISECYIKQKEKTLNFLKTNNLNKFTINKAISKCRDSFRVSSKEKDMLLTYKK